MDIGSIYLGYPVDMGVVTQLVLRESEDCQGCMGSASGCLLPLCNAARFALQGIDSDKITWTGIFVNVITSSQIPVPWDWCLW